MIVAACIRVCMRVTDRARCCTNRTCVSKPHTIYGIYAAVRSECALKRHTADSMTILSTCMCNKTCHSDWRPEETTYDDAKETHTDTKKENERERNRERGKDTLNSFVCTHDNTFNLCWSVWEGKKYRRWQRQTETIPQRTETNRIIAIMIIIIILPTTTARKSSS